MSSLGGDGGFPYYQEKVSQGPGMGDTDTPTSVPPIRETVPIEWGKVKAPDQIAGFDTGAIRSSNEGKGQPSLLPFDALVELSKHFEEGAKHYAPRNWEKGIPLSRYVDSMFRHLSAIMDGDNSEPHHRAMAWNAICFLATWIRIEQGKLPTDLCDLPNTDLSWMGGGQ